MMDEWICDVCGEKFKTEVDLLAHQFNSPCERELQKREQAAEHAKLQAIATAARPLVGTMQNLIDDNHLESPEVLNDVWVQVLGSDLVKLAAALAALEQETK